MKAAIDVGSNTLRMLVARPEGGRLRDCRYFREITRLGGGMDDRRGLDPIRAENSLQVLEDFSRELKRLSVGQVRAVGTAVLRRAVNAGEFLAAARARTGIDIEVIDGIREGELSCRGILSVLDPVPVRAIFFDIGGGSTELLLMEAGVIVAQTSLPLGVVRLWEESCGRDAWRHVVTGELSRLAALPLWQEALEQKGACALIGTAGTVTTLAAMKLELTDYNGERVNNQVLPKVWIEALADRLEGLTPQQRLKIPGLEAGREEIIMPGLQLVAALLEFCGGDSLRVADAGLLEGLLLEDW